MRHTTDNHSTLAMRFPDDVTSTFDEFPFEDDEQPESLRTVDDILAEVPHAFAAYRDHRQNEWE